MRRSIVLLCALALAAPAMAQEEVPAEGLEEGAATAAAPAVESPEVDANATEPTDDSSSPETDSITTSAEASGPVVSAEPEAGVEAGVEAAATIEPERPDEPAAAEPVTQAVDDEVPPAPEPTESSDGDHEWSDDLAIHGFADAYVQATWTLPEPFSGDQSGVLGHRPFTHIGGLTVSFVGLDMEYESDDVGATINLRFGTSTPRLLGATSGLPDGMQFLKQAYASWRPFEGAQIDFGQFDTIYGAEVSESWQNHNYSRGALYNLVQPFYHTGFRVAYAPPDTGLTFTGLAVNGWNNVLDDNDMKTFGLQVGYENSGVAVSAGYLGGPEGAGNEDLWRHFADVLVTVEVGDLELAANADYVAEELGGGMFDQLWGVMVSARLRFAPYVALGLRGEYIGDPDTDTGLATGTFTIEVTPMEHLIIRLDSRVDLSTDDTFQDPSGAPSPTAVSSILGMVVRTN